MVCYEGNEDGFWLLWIVAAVGFCAFAIFVPAVLAEILYKANRPAPAAARLVPRSAPPGQASAARRRLVAQRVDHLQARGIARGRGGHLPDGQRYQ